MINYFAILRLNFLRDNQISYEPVLESGQPELSKTKKNVKRSGDLVSDKVGGSSTKTSTDLHSILYFVLF